MYASNNFQIYQVQNGQLVSITGEHRYNTIVGLQWVKSCYKWIVLYKKINQKTIPKTDE